MKGLIGSQRVRKNHEGSRRVQDGPYCSKGSSNAPEGKGFLRGSHRVPKGHVGSSWSMKGLRGPQRSQSDKMYVPSFFLLRLY